MEASKKQHLPTQKHMIPIIIFLVTTTCCISASRAGLPEMDKDQFLAGHSRLRACVNAPPLLWNEKLAQEAREFVRKHKKLCCDAPPNPTLHGENFYCYKGESPDDANPFSYWDWQKVGYENKTKTCTIGEDCFGYLQAVSFDSNTVGCAEVTCDGGGLLAVCYYEPPAIGAPFPRPPVRKV